MTGITITGLQKAFDQPVLSDVNLDVGPGEITAILGASGTGKSTLLRCVAGLLAPDAGEIRLGSTRVDGRGTHVPAQHRRVGLVPQEGALFPHLSVADNVGFGLPRRGRQSRVAELLHLVGLPGTENLRPHELSGGMQQRVAVARALAPRPAVMVLDEPFSALDAGLREDVRQDVFAAIRADGTTTLLVTHDQEEAFSVADRVAVMMAGTIVQHARPAQLYGEPATLAVAQFVGDTVVLAAGGAEVVVYRPEQLTLDTGTALGAGLVTGIRFHGHDSLVRIEVGGQAVHMRTLGASDVQVGEQVTVYAKSPGMRFAV